MTCVTYTNHETGVTTTLELQGDPFEVCDKGAALAVPCAVRGRMEAEALKRERQTTVTYRKRFSKEQP